MTFKREPNTEYILSLSYGKDSLACLEAIKQLGYPLDRIVHVEVWATDTIPADLPPMVEFKKKADEIILNRYGIKVEHVCATRAIERERESRLFRENYERLFYSRFTKGKHTGEIYGFPQTIGAWCNDRLKVSILEKIKTGNIRGEILPCSTVGKTNRGDMGLSDVDRQRELVQQVENEAFSPSSLAQGAKKNIVQYLGIALDEPERIKRHTKPNIILPLVDIGWNEEYCREWCEQNDLLSPIYTSATRGGCWFCHNQGVDQLRLLRKDYPELWALLLKWDKDSPVTFKPNGLTVHDYDKRFYMEDIGVLKVGDKRFRWKQVNDFDIEKEVLYEIKA